MDTGTLNFAWSQALTAGLFAAGCRHAVLSPGSRSTPLALALLRQTGLTTRVAVDERSAAFFALGIAKASQRPVIVLATSGTAPANWLPAVIEASQGGHPLILISADRPPELYGVGANQTIDQIKLFGDHVRAAHALGAPSAGFEAAYLHRLAARLVEQACGPLPGPVHVNQPFHEPLIPTVDALPEAKTPEIRIARPLPPAPEPTVIAQLARQIAGRPGAIVVGELPPTPSLDAALGALADTLACPLLIEPLSGLRFGPAPLPHACTRYAHWSGTLARRPEWVLRLGAWPVTRALQQWVAQVPEHILIEPQARWSDPAHRLNHLLRSDLVLTCRALAQAMLEQSLPPGPADWLADVLAAEAEAPPLGTAWPIPVLLEALSADCALFVGNSLAIRQLDLHGARSAQPCRVYGNRGASGIDGNIATAAGLAAVHGQAVALLGDLTTQHDLGSLALAATQNLVILTVNNGGGGIFDFLPQAALPEFERGWRTPQTIDFAHAAAAFGLDYARADTPDSLAAALQNRTRAGGAHLVECRIG